MSTLCDMHITGDFMVKVSVKSKLTLFTFLIYVSKNILSVHVLKRKMFS